MQSVKTFFITFLSSVCVVLFSFMALYWSLAPGDRSVGTPQDNIPIISADSTDNKTTLVLVQTGTDSQFMLIKLNAVDKLVSVTAISADYHISAQNRTLAESFDYAGIMQCVQDLSENLSIVIDYHILLESEDLTKLSSSFAGTDHDAVPSSKTPLQLAYHTSEIIKSNLSDIQNHTLNNIPKEFSYLSTNIGKTEAAKLSRILTLLQRSQVQYVYTAITDTVS